MKLSDLLNYDDIVIQCHDNPDADALASGYAIHSYLTEHGKLPRFIYRGRREINKNNIKKMIKDLEIPISYEPDFSEEPELLVTTDCQYGQSNVTCGKAKNVAVIDHHQVNGELPELKEVRSRLGSCSTVVWDMLREEGYNVNSNMNLATALHFGLYTDTGKLTEISHPLDRDMLDALITDNDLIRQLSLSVISLDELKITGKAILGFEYFKERSALIIEAEECDPTILGVMSDFALETEDVNICVAFYKTSQQIKFSVRSCTKEAHANELAEYISDGLGGGGGHLFKAGGFLFTEKVEEDPKKLIRDRIDRYFKKFKIIYAKDTVLDSTDMKVYEKLPVEVGTVKLSMLYPVGTPVEIRTLEGDINVFVESDTYLMIGVEGEIYPIREAKLKSSYAPSGSSYNKSFEYSPTIKNTLTGEKKTVIEYADAVIGVGKTKIMARPLGENEYVKLFTAWDNEKYYSGKPGDYIAYREDDVHDIYIIQKDLFSLLYKPAE